MTTSNIVDISNQHFSSGDKLLLDTCVWLDIYYHRSSGRNRVVAYSAALRDIKVAKSDIYITECVLSEFINRYARLEQKIKAPSSSDFKAFRATAQFKGIAQDIAMACKRILSSCNWCNSNCSSQDIDSILHDYAAGGKDFNDQIITHLCKSNTLTLVTHDADFADCGLNILTANNSIL